MKKGIALMLTVVLLMSVCGCFGGPKQMSADDVDADLLNNTWQMDFWVSDDSSGDTYILQYKLNVTITELALDLYSMEFATVSAAYADGTTDDIVNIEGSTTGTVFNGVLKFMLPDIDTVIFNMDFWKQGGEEIGSAEAYDSSNGLYYYLEMYV